jgi:hypothetical protein
MKMSHLARVYASTPEEREEKRALLSAYMDSMAPVRGMEQVKFSKTRACSNCGEIGFVPTHHKYLCVFCWRNYGNLQPRGEETIPPHKRTKKRIPIRRADEPIEPEVYSTVVYSSKDMTQEQLRAILDS